MKKTRFLFALLMAIVMMALSPQRMWAAHNLVVDNTSYDFDENDEVTLNLTTGQRIQLELSSQKAGSPAQCTSTTPIRLNGSDVSDIPFDWGDYSYMIVGISGSYKFKLSEVSVSEEEVPITQWVPTFDTDPETGATIEMGGYEDVVGYVYNIINASAKLSVTCISTDGEHQHVYDQNFTDIEGALVLAETCTEKGIYYMSCACGELGTETFEVDALGHSLVAQGDRVASHATCTENEKRYKTCEICGEESDTETYTVYNTLLGHQWTDNGGVQHVCQREGCGASGDHYWFDGQCYTCGYECQHPSANPYGDIHQCTICYSEESHKWTDGTCTVCDKTCDHHWEEGTCTICYTDCSHQYSAQDEESHICSICSHTEDHSVVTDEAVDATCTTAGLTAGSHCSVCGEVLVAQEVIPALGHTPVTDEGKNATCVEPGLTAGSHCEVCEEVLEAQEELPPLGHNYGYEKNLGDDGYHHPVCECEGCDALSDEKYAKMFGEYRKVGIDPQTATIQLTKVGNWYYTSLYTDFPYNILDHDGLMYTYTVESVSNGVISLLDIDLDESGVSANSGIIIKAEDRECTIEYAPDIYIKEEEEGEEEEKIYFSPLLTGSETEVTEPAANQYAFGLSDTGYLGFWQWTGMKIPAWKAYLDLGSETATEARGFRIVFDDETNGIQQLPADASAIEGSYDLMGHKVREVKGLGIVNGKKVFVNY